MCTRREIFEIIKDHISSSLDEQLQVLEKGLSEKYKVCFKINEESKSDLKKHLCNLKNKWIASSYTTHRFLRKNEAWLQGSLSIMTDSCRPAIATKKGRPSVEFDAASERTKRRRIEKLRAKASTSELALATEMNLRASGLHQAASVIKSVTTNSPERASKYQNALKSSSIPTVAEVRAEEALALIIDAKLSKDGYQKIRNLQSKYGTIFLPSYKKVLKSKLDCYPLGIKVTETSAEVELQSLLNHTCARLLKVVNEKINNLSPEILRTLKCILKWGFDGSSGQSQYKQKFRDDNRSDANVFFTSLVPLQIVGKNTDSKETIIIWKNQRPSSPRYCRPIRLQFLHENKQSTLAEEKYIDSQIRSLVPFHTIIDGKETTVNYEMVLTMIDGKVINAVTDTTSSLRCHLCNLTSKDFNNMDLISTKKINESHLRYGMSSLHAWIRFFECFLHIGYKCKVQKWQVRTKSEKEEISERKKLIQKGFRDILGLLVNFPKPGYGSTNDGNTARRFFANVSESASILGVDEELMKKCHIVLQVMASGSAVNVDKFREYCLSVATKFVELYPWYNMPTAVHKVLIHGHQIIEWAPLPIGQLSEEAQESRNKDIKKFRECYARKDSREHNLRDMFNRLLISSDPFITSFSNLKSKTGKDLSVEALELLSPSVKSSMSDLLNFCEHSDSDPDSVSSESD